MKLRMTLYALVAGVTVFALAGCEPATQRHTPPPKDAPQPAQNNVSRSDPGAFQRTSPPPYSP